MELFLLYAMGLTIVAFLSIVMASPKILPAARHGSDNEVKPLEPGSGKEAVHNNSPEEVVFSEATPTAQSDSTDDAVSSNTEHI